MIEKYKQGITLFSIISIIAILFPPIVWITSSGYIRDKGFSFLFSISNYKNSSLAGSINFGQLLLELVIIFIISVLFQLYFKKIKQNINSNKIDS